MANVIDHLIAKFHGSRREFAEAAECSYSNVGEMRRSGQVSAKRIKILLQNAERYGVELTLQDFFPADASEHPTEEKVPCMEAGAAE